MQEAPQSLKPELKIQKISASLLACLRDVNDFPRKGVIFKDITPLLADPVLLGDVVDAFVEKIKRFRPNCIAGIEARGFIFGSLVANKMQLPFVPIRKPGKLPWKTKKIEYALEYGTASIEIHEDAFKSSDKVAIVDDLLATGGTCEAACKLVKSAGASVVASAFVIELSFLKGRELIGKESPVISLVTS